MFPDSHIQTLSQFAQSHMTGDESYDEFLRLKLDHSLRVFHNALYLVEHETIPDDQILHCKLAALYHDIGRFPQFTQFRTFNDRESTNHGRLGVLTLRSLSLPDSNITEEDWRIIRFAVAQHNVKTTRPTLPEKLKHPTNIVRDADKIDIYNVMVQHFTSSHQDPVITHGFKEIPGVYSEKIYNSVLANETADYTWIRSANDFKLLAIGWIYTLNYTSSIRLIDERGHIDNLFSLLPKDKRMQVLEEKALEFIYYKSKEGS